MRSISEARGRRTSLAGMVLSFMGLLAALIIVLTTMLTPPAIPDSDSPRLAISADLGQR
jgi:hypothetical protein